MTTDTSDFDYVTRSTKILFLAPAALTYGNLFTQSYVVKEQCYFKTADPLFFVPDHNGHPGWDFAGRLDDTNHFQALEYKSLLTLGLGGGKAQLNTWPVELVSLSDMPEVFIQERLTILEKTKLAAGEQHELVQDFLEQRQQVQRDVTILESRYDPRLECPEPKRPWYRAAALVRAGLAKS